MRIPSSNALRPHEFGTRRNIFFNNEKYIVVEGIDRNMNLENNDSVSIFKSMSSKIK